MKKICIATGTRAEYGLLKTVIDLVDRDNELELHLAVTGMHLSNEFGMTINEIIADGYAIDAKIDMSINSASSVSMAKSMSLALVGFAEYFDRQRPDIVIILGDRYEMLMVAVASLVSRVPIAHIHGGELTEGAIDEAIRHSITKMSHLHFSSTESYKKRIIQLGECASNVYNVGALGVENLKNINYISCEELSADLGIDLNKKTILFTYHPVTLNHITSKEQIRSIFSVLDKHKEYQVLFTKANSDTDGRIINSEIERYVLENNDRCIFVSSLGQVRYLSSLRYCSMVMGNSSSGLIEVPSFHIPTINIGDRQRGRLCGETVISCECKHEDIEAAFIKATSESFMKRVSMMTNPYEGKETSRRIVHTIKTRLQEGIDIKKKFNDIAF